MMLLPSPTGDDTQAVRDASYSGRPLGPGKFMVDRFLYDGIDQSLRGHGMFATVLKHRQPVGPIFQAEANAKGGVFEDLMIEGSGHQDILERGIEMVSATAASVGSDTKFRNIHVFRTGGEAVHQDVAYRVRWDQCRFHRPTGINRGNNVRYVTVLNGDQTSFTRCVFFTYGSDGLDAPVGMLKVGDGTHFTTAGLLFDGCSTHGCSPRNGSQLIEVEAGRHVVMRNWRFWDIKDIDAADDRVYARYLKSDKELTKVGDNDYMGNEWYGEIPGSNLPQGHPVAPTRMTGGIAIESDHNVFEGPRSGFGNSIKFLPGARKNRVRFTANQEPPWGQQYESWPLFVDESGKPNNKVYNENGKRVR